MSHSWAGVDVGVTGAVAVVDGRGCLVQCWDMPTHVPDVRRGKGQRKVRELDLRGLGKIVAELVELAPLVVAIEAQQGRGNQGAQAGLALGRQWGAIEGMTHQAGLHLDQVHPATWKRAIGATRDKALSRTLATARWPDREDLFRRAKDDGRAEACLIAAWARAVHLGVR